MRPNMQVLPQRSDMFSTCSRLQNILTVSLLQDAPEIAADEIITLPNNHRKEANEANHFYRACQVAAKNAYNSRSLRDGKDHLKKLVLSIYFAQSTEIPRSNDKDGQLLVVDLAKFKPGRWFGLLKLNLL